MGELRPGKLIGSFELQRQLQTSTTGAVWLVQDYDVKRQADQSELQFLPDFIVRDECAMQKLKNEIGRRTALKHPNILRVLNLVENNGNVAIQVEHVDGGQSLSDLRFTRPNRVFEVGDLEKWVKELCEALEYAHKEIGLICDSVCPHNLIVDRAGNLKLRDFGISNCIGDAICSSTPTWDVSETLAYKSPQCLAGEEPAISDDIYSLGATIFELLTSKPPFYGENSIARVNAEIPPSMTDKRVELGIAGGTIPGNWENTVAACLAKDPLQRPKSAIEVKVRLQKLRSQSDFPHASTLKPTPPVASQITPKPWITGAGILSILVGAAAVGMFSLHRLTERHLAKENPASLVEGSPELNREPASKPSPSPLPQISSGASPVSAASPTTAPEAASKMSPAAPPQPGATGAPEPGDATPPQVSATQAAEAGAKAESESVAAPETSPKAGSEAVAANASEGSPTPAQNVAAESGPAGVPSRQEPSVHDEQESVSRAPNLVSEQNIDATRAAVIKRIQALPAATIEKKAGLIEKMYKARSIERLTVVPFDAGRTALRKAAAEEIVKLFERPEIQNKLSDPTTILVVAGYADFGGREDINLHISQERAENVSKILREQAKVSNALQTVGMGGTELLDSTRPDQNRAVEVWAVVPL
jgi:serine/threonine protein kinase